MRIYARSFFFYACLPGISATPDRRRKGDFFVNEDQKELLKLAAGDSRAIRIGDSVLYPPVMVSGKAFQFDPWQNGFLYHLQASQGDMELACRKINKSIEWAQKFVSTRKFREFRNAKLQTLAIRAGDVVDWWWEMGLAGAKGFVEWWEGTCELCHEPNKFSTIEAESFRNEDMVLKAACKVCFQPLSLEYRKEEFKPSREQVQFWSELGNRVSPKIERVSHEFSSENFVFRTEDGV